MTAGWPFDAYDTRARAFPLLAATAPVGLLVASISTATWDAVAGMLGMGGMVLFAYALLFILNQWVRDCGYRLEKALWASWEGPPTTRFLRHRDEKFSDVVTQGYHSRIEAANSGWKAPTQATEQADPKAADRAYEAAAKWLKTTAVGTPRYSLVEDANSRYGFRRNCLGIWKFGFALSCFAALGNGFVLVLAWPIQGVDWLVVASTLLTFGMAYFWVSVNEAYVHVAAQVYAERLIECVDGL